MEGLFTHIYIFLSSLSPSRNIAEALISKGLGSCLRHRQDDDQRASCYDNLLAAEARAIKNAKGIQSKKEPPIHRVADFSQVNRGEGEGEREGEAWNSLPLTFLRMFPLLLGACQGQGVPSFPAESRQNSSTGRGEVYIYVRVYLYFILFIFILGGRGE